MSDGLTRLTYRFKARAFKRPRTFLINTQEPNRKYQLVIWDRILNDEIAMDLEEAKAVVAWLRQQLKILKVGKKHVKRGKKGGG